MVLGVWARRSLAVWTAPLVLGALVFSVWTMHGWQFESLWGTRGVLEIFPLVSPLVAGAVAFDVARRWQPVVAELGPSTRRWRWATLAVPAAHVLWAFAMVCLVWASVAVRLSIGPTIWQSDPWLPVEVIAALAASASVGLLIGMRVPDPISAPMAAIVVFAVETLGVPYGVDSLFTSAALRESAVGLSRDPWSATLTVALDGALIAWCCLVALRQGRRTSGWLAAVAVASVALIGLEAIPGHATPTLWRAASSQQVCTSHDDVRVCGPPNAMPFLDDLSHELTAARRTLTGSQLRLPDRYVLGTYGITPSTDGGDTTAFVTPARLAVDNHAAIADVLSQPRICPQLLNPDNDTRTLLDEQEKVRAWLSEALQTRQTNAAPAGVQAAYHDLVTCDPTT